MEYLKREGENTTDYLLRLVEIKLEQKPDDLDWSDIVKYCGFDCHYDSLRKAMQPSGYGAYAIYKYYKDKIVKEKITDSDIEKQLNITKRELYIERQKLRDEKNEYNAFLREQSRIELFYERIDESVDKIVQKKQYLIPSSIIVNDNDLKMVVAFADPHFGADFKIKGFNDEILNEYNPEIFRFRMWKLRDEILEFCKLHNCNHISCVDLGDSIEGILHISQLQSLKGNIVDDILDYADFICDWINNLSENKLVIDFYSSEGNHSELRLLTGKKGDFPNENLEKIYTRTVKKAFKNNPNVNIKDSLNGLNYFEVNGYKFLSAHGNKEGSIKDSITGYENTYNIEIDYFLVGHLHSKNEFEVAKGKEVIQVRALMGINDFSTTIKKTSSAGATMFTVHKNYGKKYINEVKFN
ncbi:MAG TPA: hypothetical protein VIK86_08010 [Candidatus Paceibacterota bacterium]